MSQAVDKAVTVGQIRRVPLVLMGLGGLYYLLLSLLLPVLLPSIAEVWQRNPWALLETHLFTLGFVTTMLMGGIYQLLMRRLGLSLWRPMWLWPQLGLYSVGTVVMLVGLVRYDGAWLIPGGTLVVGAVWLFLMNAWRTLRTAPGSAMTLVLKWALVYLAVVVFMGLTLAVNVQFGFMKGATRSHIIMHAVQGFGGWFTLGGLALAFGVSGVSGQAVRAGLWLINAGLLGHIALVGFRVPPLALSGCALLFGAGVWLLVRQMGSGGVAIGVKIGAVALSAALLLAVIHLFVPYTPIDEGRSAALLILTGLGWIAPVLLALVPVGQQLIPWLVGTVAVLIGGLWLSSIPLAVAGATMHSVVVARLAFVLWPGFLRRWREDAA